MICLIDNHVRWFHQRKVFVKFGENLIKITAAAFVLTHYKRTWFCELAFRTLERDFTMNYNVIPNLVLP